MVSQTSGNIHLEYLHDFHPQLNHSEAPSSSWKRSNIVHPRPPRPLTSKRSRAPPSRPTITKLTENVLLIVLYNIHKRRDRPQLPSGSTTRPNRIFDRPPKVTTLNFNHALISSSIFLQRERKRLQTHLQHFPSLQHQFQTPRGSSSPPKSRPNII